MREIDMKMSRFSPHHPEDRWRFNRIPSREELGGDGPKPGFWDRVWRAAKLESGLYDEVKADKEANEQAVGVVVIATLAHALADPVGIVFFILSPVLGIALWLLGLGIVYWLGVKVFPEAETEDDFGGVLRAFGFSTAPGLIVLIGILPGLGGLFLFVAFVWGFVADYVAFR
jgi:hypothetical protein